jgi:hypothetical protein
VDGIDQYVLKDGAKCASVRTQIISTGATIVCLLETKINNWTRELLVDTVGAELATNVAFLPSVGVCGGTLMAASERYFILSQPFLTNNTVSATITMLHKNKVWSLTGVYGPQSDEDKILFLQELMDLRAHTLPTDSLVTNLPKNRPSSIGLTWFGPQRPVLVGHKSRCWS